MKKFYSVVLLLAVLALLCGCVHQPPLDTTPTQPSTQATNPPGSEGPSKPETAPTTEPTTEPTTAPTTQPTTEPVPSEEEEMAKLGFVPLSEKGHYLYTGTDSAIPIPNSDLVLTLPEGWLEDVYVIARPKYRNASSACLQVVGKKLHHARWGLSEPTLQQLQADGIWNVYLFRVYQVEADQRQPIRDGMFVGCEHERDTVIGENGSMLILTERQVLCPDCKTSQDYLPRGALSQQMGEDAYAAADGNWMPSIDEISEMISIAP